MLHVVGQTQYRGVLQGVEAVNLACMKRVFARADRDTPRCSRTKELSQDSAGEARKEARDQGGENKGKVLRKR